MGPIVHTLSSSEDSDDSLPDLQTRLCSKKPQTIQKKIQVHSISSDDESYIENGEKVTDIDEDPGIIIEENTQPTFNKDNFKDITDPFEEDLPEIHDFTLITSETRQSSEEVEREASPLKLPTKKSRKEEVLLEKEAKRKEREAKRLQKAAEKAEAKAQREAEKTAKRAMKPGECMKYVIVQLDRQLLELPEGSQVISQLQESNLRYRVVDSPVSAATTILRIDPLSLQETLTEEAVLVMKVKELIQLVEYQIYEDGINGLCDKCRTWKRELGMQKLTLVICGIDNYLRNQKTNRNQNFRSEVIGETSRPGRGRKRKVQANGSESLTERVSRVDIETALVMAQIECGVNHRMMSDAAKVGMFISQFTKSVAETPFKREKGEPSFSWYAEGSSTNTVKVDKSGVGLLKLWHQQLRQFNSVGVEVAQAIGREYQSPCALVEAYRQCTTSKEASLLLADIPVRRGTGPLVSTRKIGPELSKKIHLFFTSREPEVSLGQKN